MINYLQYIGLKTNEQEEVSIQTFVPSPTKEIAVKYLDYLKEIDHYQKERRTIIEGKNSQLVGQASIVTSIFSLFVPLLVDNYNYLSYWISIPFSLLFLFILAHYLLTIIHSIRTLKINRYRYPTRSTLTLTKENRAVTELDFMNEEIADLVFIVNKSAPIDNFKGQNLIFATRCFEIASISFGILTLAIIVSTYFFNKESPETTPKSLKTIKVEAIDTLDHQLMNLEKMDSITGNMDTLTIEKKR